VWWRRIAAAFERESSASGERARAARISITGCRRARDGYGNTDPANDIDLSTTEAFDDRARVERG